MRINKIEMENLNSLKGYWCIDFTNSDYKKNHDLFVICGETGAGKTTILDAITLALYGRTPRQDSFGSTNEVMTRHTSRCLARVTYTCKNGTFESEFMQNRARDKIDGNLVQASCRIKNIDTGEESGKLAIASLAKKTSEIIHLDYQQFCRSIMLAQGEFDTFIMGDERSRSAILAKLNGTEHYKEIGARVCTKAGKIRKDLESLKKDRDSIEILAEEEIELLNQEKEKRQKENENLKTLEDKNTEILKWLENLEKSQQKFSEAKENRRMYEAKKEEFAEDEKKLAAGEKAEACEKDYLFFESLEQENEKAVQNLAVAEQALKECDKKIADALFAETEAKSAYDDLKGKEKELRKLWKDVLNIDSQLAPVKESCGKYEEVKVSAEKDYSEKKEELAFIDEKILKLEEEILNLSSYLCEHKDDCELKEIIAALKQKKNIFASLETEMNNAGQDLENQRMKLNAFEASAKEAEINLSNLEDRLKKYVSDEFIIISVMLRKSLEQGKPCPVCGSLNHPAENNCDGIFNREHKNDESENDYMENVAAENAVTENVAVLNREIETEKIRLEKINSEIVAAREKVSNAEKVKSDNFEKCRTESKEIASLISRWKKYDVSEKELDYNDKFIEELETVIKMLFSLAKTYEEKNDLLLNANKNLEIQKNKKKGIDLKKLKENLKQAEDNYAEEKEKYDSLNTRRRQLFGDKLVEDEEKLFSERLVQLENEYKKKAEKKIKLEKEKSGFESRVGQLKEQIEGRKIELSSAEESFEQSLAKNGFENRREFLNSRLTEEEINTLKKEQVDLNKKDAESASEFKKASEELDDIEKLNLTEKKREEIEAENKGYEKKKKDNSERIGAINEKFESDEKNRKRFAELQAYYEQLCAEDALWQEMKSFIGKNSGEDFEVFVEALAFSQLLEKANKYVRAISGKYTLVQKEGKVDFLVHDDNYPDSKEDRPITNMSGGEKFIISLSLALGIAELASMNVSVDSLFLDEGFGTLSGEPLFEAVNALKMLQSSGKMLGIITHVEGVIREFDQKIEAVKKSGGVSELKGSGITHRGAYVT